MPSEREERGERRETGFLEPNPARGKVDGRFAVLADDWELAARGKVE